MLKEVGTRNKEKGGFQQEGEIVDDDLQIKSGPSEFFNILT